VSCRFAVARVGTGALLPGYPEGTGFRSLTQLTVSAAGSPGPALLFLRQTRQGEPATPCAPRMAVIAIGAEVIEVRAHAPGDRD
jgi:hypothetical protein